MNDFTIANEYTLPSNGKVYTQKINPTFKLRSMTTVEEMKRLNHSDKPNKNLAEIIDDCLITDLGISAYDLCTPDYQYVLHKLRLVTYGSDYKLTSDCPWCGTKNTNVVNLDELKFVEFDEEIFKKYSEFDLPSTKRHITLRMQTPRILDKITTEVKEIKKKYPDFVGDPAFLFTIENVIDTIDGKVPEQFKLKPFIEKLPMMDTNYIVKSALKLNTSFGLDSSLEHSCSYCGLDYTGNFRITPEFFGPSID